MTRTLEHEQASKFGTQLTPSGTRFRLWAPGAQAVSVKILLSRQVRPLTQGERGWFETEVEGVTAGDRYKFVLADGTEVPDPASRFQPDDTDGASEVIDPRAYRWTDAGWVGRPWEETVIYELHIGTFTQEGTFLAAIDKLDHLVALGVTALELMPLAHFAGRWNWGYDGALLFAPDSSYGRPEDLKRLIDAAHSHGLMVFLDVVYNHFGPKGNYMAGYAPVTTDKHLTDWGEGINYDDEGSRQIRDFMFANARHWLNEYRFDGLRLDAVHAIKDDGPKHILEALAEQVRASTDGRHIHLMLENSRNQAGWMKRQDDGTPWLYSAQWSDDVHHTLHVATTGETHGYYADYAGRIDLVGRALAEGFGFQGEEKPVEREAWGEPSAFLPPTAFISFGQNHDHLGNRPLGERLHQLVPEQAARTVAALILLSPQIPLLFMGEEWAADQPFLYFTDVGEDLAAPIREGRKREARAQPGLEGQELPDPLSEETFRRSKLDWSQLDGERQARFLSLYRKLLELRREHIVPLLKNAPGHAGHYEMIGPKALRVWWDLSGYRLSVIANLGPDPLDNVNVWGADHLWLEGFASGTTLDPWSAVFQLSTLETNGG